MTSNAETSTPRTPEQILADFDAGCRGEADIDMRAVLWEVIEDLLDSLGRYEAWDFEESATPAEIVRQCKGMLTDYLVNNYGDD